MSHSGAGGDAEDCPTQFDRFGPVIVAMSGLYVIIQGFALMRGQRHFGAADMIASCLKIAIIVTVAGGAGTYLEYVAIPLS